MVITMNDSYESIALFLSSLIGHLPDICKYCQWTVREKTHQKKTLIRIYNVDLTHTAFVQDFLNFFQKMMIPVIRIIILHLLRHDKKFESDQVKSFYRKFMIQNTVDSLSAETFLAESALPG